MSSVSTKRSVKNEDKSPAKRVKPLDATSSIKIVMEAEDFYNLEDKIAHSTTHSELEKAFLVESSALRAAVEKIVDGQACPSSVLLNIARMRRFSRLSQFATAQLRKESANRLEQVEAKYLQLQNSSSEIQHLQKEINRCLQFSSADEDIDLVPIEEFYSSAPDSIARPDVTREDEHEQRLARLTWEIAQRKQLVSTLNEQEGRRNVLISDINGKEQRLKSLKSKIDGLMAAAKPVQEALGVGNASASSAEQRSLFSLLPHDLSVLYVQAEAYRDIMDDTSMQVVICGSSDEALMLTRRQKDDNEDRDSDDEEGDHERRQRTVSERLEMNKQFITEPHPIYLNIDIGCQDDVKVGLKLQYLPELRVTVLKYKISGKLPTYGSVSSDENLLDDLFPSDDGSECPNPIGAAKLQQLKLSVDSFAAKLGRPYRFVQALSGSDGSVISNVGGVQLADALQRVIQSIRNRVSNRLALVKQLKALESDRTEALRGVDVEVPVKMITQLISFKMISEETFLSSIPTGMQSVCSDEGLGFYFLAIFENKPASLKVHTWVKVSADYPNQVPLCSIALTKDGKTYNTQSSHLVKSLEHYVNVFCISSEGVIADSVLTRQMAHLASRCDVIADLDPQLNPSESQPQHLYNRSSRGRDGDIPFHYIPSTNSFSFK